MGIFADTTFAPAGEISKEKLLTNQTLAKASEVKAG
jgi:hypothetical protein